MSKTVEYDRYKQPATTAELVECLLLPFALVSFPFKSLTAEQAVPVWKALETNSSLTSLDLGNNYLGDDGATELFNSIVHNQTLQILDLQKNGIGDKATEALAVVLSENNALTSLNLNENELATQGAENIAQGLVGNKSLTTLYLFRNNIGSEGAMRLSESLNSNIALTTLYLGENSAQTEVLTDITEKIRRNTQIQEKRQKSAFEEAVSGNDKAPWRRAKLVLVGEGGAGKTAMLRSLTNERFNPEWESTLGITISEVASTNTNRWDETKDDEFLTSFVNRLAIEKLEAEKKAQQGKKSVGNKSRKKKGRKGGRKGPGSRIEDRRGSFQSGYQSQYEEVELDGEARDERRPTLIKYDEDMLLQSKANEKAITIAIWDFGGQEVFYTLHHLFLTEYSVYLLMFDMRKILTKNERVRANALKYISFWVNSVFLHAPDAPLLLAGTFGDLITEKEQHEAVHMALCEQLGEQLISKVVHPGKSSSHGFAFFPIDNKERKGIDPLRTKIESVVRKQDYVNVLVSVKWIQSLDLLISQQESWLSLATVRETVKDFLPPSWPEFEEMLKLFHELGIILHFTATAALSEVVILDPQWLIDSFSKVIFDADIHTVQGIQELEKMNLVNEAIILSREGIVTRDLLEFLWEKESVEFLLDLMRRLLLIGNWNFKDSDEQYLIPSMVASPLPKRISLEEGEGVRSEFVFEYLPNGVFERVVCMFVDYSSTKEASVKPRLYKGYCIVFFGKVELRLELAEQKIILYVLDSAHAARCLRIVEAMLNKLKYNAMAGRLGWEVLVQQGESMVPLKKLQQSNTSSDWVRGKSAAFKGFKDSAIDEFLKLFE